MPGNASNAPVRVGLIGAGRMGMNHLRVIGNDPRFQLAVIVDPRPAPEAAAYIARGAALFDNLTALDRASIDAAIIAAPTPEHAGLTEILIRSGIACLVEKPLCSSYRDARRLASIARALKVPLAVGHVERFNPAVSCLRQVTRSGVLGTPIHYSFTRVGGYPGDADGKGNVLMDLAVHDLDLFRLFAGKPRVIASVCHCIRSPGVPDTAEVLLSSESAASASIHVNWVTATKMRNVRVTGTRGVALVDYMMQTCVVYGGSDIERRPPKIEFSALVEDYKNIEHRKFDVKMLEPLQVQLDHFHRLLGNEPNESCNGFEAAYSIRLAEQAVTRVK